MEWALGSSDRVFIVFLGLFRRTRMKAGSKWKSSKNNANATVLRPYTGSTRGLNLVAVRLTTVQVVLK